jgi:hypothetical protein
MGKRRGKKIYRASPYTHPLYRRWMLDFDYLEKLDDKSQTWLAQFSDEYYANDFDFDEPLIPDPAERRKVMRDLGRNARDVYSRKAAVGAMDYEPELGSREVGLGPTPKYQNSPEYRAALAEYRKLLDAKPVVASTRADGQFINRSMPRSPKDRARLEMLQAYLLSFAEADPSASGLATLLEEYPDEKD